MSSRDSRNHRIKKFNLNRKPSKVKLMQKPVQSKQVSCQDILETCQYVMQNIHARQKIDIGKIQELQKFIMLFNKKLG